MRVHSTYPFDTVEGGPEELAKSVGVRLGIWPRDSPRESPFKTVIKGCASKVSTSEWPTIRPEWSCHLAAGTVRKDVWSYRRDGHSSEVRQSRADVSMLPSQDFSGVA